MNSSLEATAVAINSLSLDVEMGKKATNILQMILDYSLEQELLTCNAEDVNVIKIYIQWAQWWNDNILEDLITATVTEYPQLIHLLQAEVKSLLLLYCYN